MYDLWTLIIVLVYIGVDKILDNQSRSSGFTVNCLLIVFLTCMRSPIDIRMTIVWFDIVLPALIICQIQFQFVFWYLLRSLPRLKYLVLNQSYRLDNNYQYCTQIFQLLLWFVTSGRRIENVPKGQFLGLKECEWIIYLFTFLMLSFTLIESRLCLREQNKIKLDGSIKLNAILNESQRTNSMYVRVFVRCNAFSTFWLTNSYSSGVIWGQKGHIFNDDQRLNHSLWWYCTYCNKYKSCCSQEPIHFFIWVFS